MILKTSTDKTYVISSDSSEFAFVLRVRGDELVKTSQFISNLTDEELSTYTLSDLDGDRTFADGHFSSMTLNAEGSRYKAVYYIVHRKGESV